MQYELGTQIRQILEDFYWARRSERDSSGTTEATRSGAKVMERIARRERSEAARPNFNVLMCKPSHELVLK